MFCSSCGTKIDEGIKFCPNCGTSAIAQSTVVTEESTVVGESTDIVPAQIPVQKSLNADEVFCSSCGAVIKKEAEICPKCGVRQIKKAASNETSVKWVAVLILNILGLNWLSRFLTGYVFKGILVLLLDILTVATLSIGVGVVLSILVAIIWLIDLIKICQKKWQTADGAYLTV